MNSEQLICFAAVVQEGTISGGARRLNLSQPPVSLQIKNLEKECGVKLLERGARQIRLTEAGKVLYDYAQKILELQQAAQSDMRSFQAGNKGSLRLGIISSGTGEKFLKGLTHFTLEHPDVPFQVYEANTYGLLEALDKEKIELALIRTPFPAAGLERTVLTQEAFAAAGSATMLYGLPDTLTLKELAGRPLLVYRRWEAILRDLGGPLGGVPLLPVPLRRRPDLPPVGGLRAGHCPGPRVVAGPGTGAAPADRERAPAGKPGVPGAEKRTEAGGSGKGVLGRV